MKKSILIVEDDTALLPMISYNLKKNDFKVFEARTGEEALLILKEENPSLILLDWMIPAPNGLKICQIIRQRNDTKELPVIMLTAKGEEENKIIGLDSGADDYISKPFKPRELVARINALLRRSNPYFSKSTLSYDDIKMDLKKHRVYRKNEKIHLGPTEFKLLRFFLENPGRVFSREQLLNNVWGHGIFVELRTIDTHIRRLRKLLNINGAKDLIRTVRASGYSIDVEKN